MGKLRDFMSKKRVAIIVSSDAGYRGEREDKSGPEIKRIVEENDGMIHYFINESGMFCCDILYKKCQ